MSTLHQKRVATVFLSALLLISSSISAYAINTAPNLSRTTVQAKISISDPQTGEEWNWIVPDSDITITTQSSKNAILNNSQSGLVNTAEVSVDASKYLALTTEQTLSSTLRDDITLKAGLIYSASAKNNSVSLKSVFGSTQPKGAYYATNRKFYWRNPGAGVGDKSSPTSNSWQIYLSSKEKIEGPYSSEVPPYVITECTVKVSGMESLSRVISVKCALDNL